MFWDGFLAHDIKNLLIMEWYCFVVWPQIVFYRSLKIF